jgi:aspartate racemase
MESTEPTQEKAAVPAGRPLHIGIAGVTVEGALLCARILAEEAEARLPAAARPEFALHFHPFAAYYRALTAGDWPTLTALLVDSIAKLGAGGADFAIIPCNVAHFAIADIVARAPLPVLDLVDETAAESARRGYTRVGVLGTRWTMDGGLFDAPLRRRGIEPVLPPPEAQQTLQTIITEELVFGRVRDDSTARLLAVVGALKAQGSQAMVLGCTELPLVLDDASCGVPVIDTTRLLAERALLHATAGAAAAAAVSS